MLQSMARVTNSSSQTITNNTVVALAFDQESFDTDGLHDTVTNNSRLTAPIAGKYLVIGGVGDAAAASTSWRFTIRKDGTITYASAGPPYGANGDTTLSALVDLGAGGYVQLTAFQNSGSDSTVAGGVETFLSMVYVGE
jgi:hypothetical protein